MMLRPLAALLLAIVLAATGARAAQERLTWQQLRTVAPVTSIQAAMADPLAVTSLRLADRPLTDRDYDVIAQLKNLEIILLNRTEISGIDPRLLALERLRVLDLSFNQLTDLPSALAGLRQIESISLYGNSFQTLPPVVAEFGNLQSIYLGQNVGLDVGQTIDVLQQVPTLRYLGLGALDLTALPTAISSLRGLIVLFLGGNQLAEIPDSLLSLEGLRMLNLANNRIEVIPNDIMRLANLERLVMRGNPLREPGLAYPFDLVR